MTAEQKSVPVVGIRHLQAFLIFLDIVVLYIARINVGVSIVAMTNAESTNPNFPEYDWTEKQKSYILSSFFWGYIFTQFLGGYLCKHFGSKFIMLVGTLGSSIFALCTPFCIPWGSWQAYCGIRVLMGLFQGLIFPCIHQHLAKWSPANERNRLGALSFTGSECGNVLAMFVTGMIAKSSIGWPGIFYVSSGLGFFWCVLWFFLSANSPPESRLISKDECNYIEDSLKHDESLHRKKIPTPWKAILTSVPFYARAISGISASWGISTLQGQIPSYMNGVLEMDIKSNAIFSALPYLAMWFMSYVYLILADVLLGRNCTTLTVLRKSFNTVALWIPALILIGIGFLTVEQETLAIILMTVSVGLTSGVTIGSILNSIDLSPNHAGILMGIINTLANMVPIVTPLVVGVIVSDVTNREQWQVVFIIAAVIFFIGNAVYIIWGSTNCQPWDAEDFLQKKATISVPTKPEPTAVAEYRKEPESDMKIN